MKIKYFHFLLVGGMLACAPSAKMDTNTAIDNSPQPLLTLGEEKIFADEFVHIYTKSQHFEGAEDKISKANFDKSLDAFINYKLKVIEAVNLGMEDSDEFDKEFTIFKEDLKKPFILKYSLQEGEIKKAYSRTQEVLKASHILLQFPQNASRQDSIAVLRMAEKIKAEAEEGADFNQLALEHSDDPTAEENKGDLGYFTALTMVQPFEDAAYDLSIGEISAPILTNYGYHIIKLEDRKPNPGEVRVSHILVRTNSADPVTEDRARQRIADIYTELQKPNADWNTVVENFSDDQSNKNTGGKLPWFGVGAIIPEFEKAAFELKDKGEISSPIKTAYGYHIIRLEDVREVPPYEVMEPALRSKILRDSRSSLIQTQVVAMQKSKFGYQENSGLIENIKPQIDQALGKSLQAVKSELEEKNLLDTTLITIAEKDRSVRDFIRFIESDQAVVKTSPQKFFQPWFDKFIQAELDIAEEQELLQNNEEYKMLVKEYRDGILLFSLMNDMVWQKALLDTAGLEAYFAKNQERYQWKERVPALIVKMNKEEQLSKVRRFLSNKAYSSRLKPAVEDQFLNDYPGLFELEDGVFEHANHAVLQKVDIAEKYHELKHDGRSHFLVLGSSIEPGPKKLSETRGKAIQDYQETLEKELIAELRERYPIQVNEEEKERVFEIIKK
ncbi:peptidyl-prolyl cis-trans isomerase [Litoribacter ruber]|uniref:peptidylprolyl isomerase n=1 Tax=Litoribacter ruber TaxID=702568 RepID=UPI001BDB6365|nr:peptidylprolyl isomerase [Litoribacter ruber]MBT0809969.1 peptidyl-prolyl cis-trans isomerase [Litoribacter ruber]